MVGVGNATSDTPHPLPEKGRGEGTLLECLRAESVRLDDALVARGDEYHIMA
jgi:hypothetical protein